MPDSSDVEDRVRVNEPPSWDEPALVRVPERPYVPTPLPESREEKEPVAVSVAVRVSEYPPRASPE